jgi:hypothetical protein
VQHRKKEVLFCSGGIFYFDEAGFVLPVCPGFFDLNRGIYKVSKTSTATPITIRTVVTC